MTLKRRILIFGSGWLVLITAMHAWLNVDWGGILNDYRPPEKHKISVAYIPVTCQLTCPVTDYISKLSDHGEVFLPRLFQGFPEIKEALISNRMQAAFIVAPLAIALRAQGAPIRVVYLGHRFGSALVVKKNGPIKTFADMRGKTIAIPSRFSDEHLLMFRAMKVLGIKSGAIKMVEMAPPDVAGALLTGAIDGYSMGGTLSIAGAVGRLRADSVSGARVLAGLHVLRSRGAAKSDRQASGCGAGTGGRNCPLRTLAERFQTTSRECRRFWLQVLLQSETGVASLGSNKATGPRYVHAPGAAQGGLRSG